MATTITDIAPLPPPAYQKPLPQLTAFKYDQLNRLLQTKAYTDINLTTNTRCDGGTYADRYFNSFSYDRKRNFYSNGLGFKQYELSNHLGNILTTISDIKIQQYYNSGNEVECYTADITAVNDYASLGGLLTERTLNKVLFPNTFNGKRDDHEPGDCKEYGMNIYSPGIRRFPTLGQIAKDYTELTTYQFASNSPILNIDIDDLEGTSALINAVYSGYNYGHRVCTHNTNNSDIASGIGNITYDTFGVNRSSAYIISTRGIGTEVGGLVALQLSLRQISIGVAHVAEATKASLHNTGTKIPKGNTIPELIAYGVDSKYSGIIDAGSEIIPNILVGGGINFLSKSWTRFYETPNLKNAASAIDATFSASDFSVEFGKLVGGKNAKNISDFQVSFTTNISVDKEKSIITASITAHYSYSVGEGNEKKTYNESKTFTKIKNVAKEE